MGVVVRLKGTYGQLLLALQKLNPLTQPIPVHWLPPVHLECVRLNRHSTRGVERFSKHTNHFTEVCTKENMVKEVHEGAKILL